MSKVTLTQIKKVNNLQDLKDLGIGNVYCDISHRGGGVGLYASAVAEHLNIPVSYLPRYVGAYCNYLGGGMRGAITSGGYNTAVSKAKAKILDALQDAAKRVYLNIEGDANDEVDDDGEINWDAKATNAARRAGVVSAY